MKKIKSVRTVVETVDGWTRTILLRNPAKVGFYQHTVPPEDTAIGIQPDPMRVVLDEERYRFGVQIVAELGELYDQGPKVVINDYQDGGYQVYLTNRIHEVLRDRRYASMFEQAQQIAELVAEIEGRS